MLSVSFLLPCGSFCLESGCSSEALCRYALLYFNVACLFTINLICYVKAKHIREMCPLGPQPKKNRNDLNSQVD